MKLIYPWVGLGIFGLWALAPVLPVAGQDSDGDGLTDFQEVHKYLTNPARAETEAGKRDGDWRQRREFTYSIRSVVRVLKPYDLEAMQDDYQDARLLRETAEFGEFEVIHYPLNTLGAGAAAHLLDEPPKEELAHWRKAGVTTDWTPEMRQQLLAELKAVGIDPGQRTPRELVEKVAAWMQGSCKSSSTIFTTFFMDFSKGGPELLAGCERAYEREKGSAGWSFEEQLQHEVLGSGMFATKTRGTCTSSAIYWTTVLRALGFPTRQILCIPAVDGNDQAQVEMVRKGIRHHRSRETMLKGLENLRGFTSHTFNEVFVEGRWTRLNYGKLDQNILDERCYGLITHTLTFHDLSETGLAQTWGLRYAQGKRSAELKTGNPFATLELNDHFGRNARVPNPEPVPPPEDHRSLTIDAIYWLRSEKRPAWLKPENFASQESADVIALMHCAEWFPDQDYRQLRRFIDKAETDFILRAPGQPEIKARITGNYTNGSQRAISLSVTKGEYAKMAPGVAYFPSAVTNKGEVVWQVEKSVTLTREGK